MPSQPPTGILALAGREGHRAQLSNTTCFFRNLPQLEVLADTAARLWPEPRALAMLHVGGSLGCEALSFLIALRERAPWLDARALSVDAHAASAEFGRSASYPASLFEEIFPGEGGDPHGWRDRWFEPSAEGSFRPRSGLAGRVRFETADASAPGALPPADAVFCQNVLIHLDRPRADPLLAKVLAAARPRALLACAGMDLDLKPHITAAGFRPVLERLEEIHDGWRACRHHWRTERGQYYFELEDIDRMRPDWQERYAQVFVRP